MIFVAVSTGHFDALIDECIKLGERYEFLAQIGSGKLEPPFRHYRTAPPERLADDIRAAEIVITHAGTGMLSMLYRERKPCIIVPKQSRYGEKNDGQVDLAVKWAELGMGILCLEVKKLEKAITQFRETTFAFPSFRPLGTRVSALITV